MNTTVKKVMVYVFIISVIISCIGAFVCLVHYNNNREKQKNYNNGICAECGGHFKLVTVIDPWNGYYECDNCNRVIKTSLPG